MNHLPWLFFSRKHKKKSRNTKQNTAPLISSLKRDFLASVEHDQEAGPCKQRHLDVGMLSFKLRIFSLVVLLYFSELDKFATNDK